MKVGFIGLGNVGFKLAASLLRNGFEPTVLDLRPEAAEALAASGAVVADTPRDLTVVSDVVIPVCPAHRLLQPFSNLPTAFSQLSMAGRSGSK